MPGLNKQDILILLMGMTGAGKTTFINKASGSNLTIGEGLESCTSEVQAANSFLLDGHVVTLIDSPGFDDTNRSEAEILREVTSFLARTYEAGRMLAGIIYLHRISDVRVGGVTKRNFSVFRKLCGESTLKNAAVVTNMWTPNASDAIREIEEGRETELATKPAFFKHALDNGARMARHYNTTQSAHAIIRQFFAHQPQPLLVQRELVDEKKCLVTTDAGSHMKEEFVALSERHQREIEEMKRQQHEQEKELATASLKIEQNAALAEELRGLRGIIERLTTELKETREALNEERKKVAHLVRQMEVLTESGAGLDRRLSETAKKVEEDIRKVKLEQRRNTAPPEYSHATRGASGETFPARERVTPHRRATTSQPYTQATQPAQDNGSDSGWCVVQ